MERGRRICWIWYRNLGLNRDSGEDKAFRYHRCISISQYLVEGFDAASSEKFCLGERFIRN